MNEKKLKPGDAAAYSVAYESTRAWGCLQRGWLDMDRERIGILGEALGRLDNLAVDAGPKVDYTGPVQEAFDLYSTLCCGANHLRLSALWCAFSDAWTDPKLGYGGLIVRVCVHVAELHQLTAASQKPLLSGVKKSLKAIGKSPVRFYANATLKEAKKYKSMTEDCLGDLYHALSHMEQLVFQVPKDPVDAEYWRGPEIRYDDKPGNMPPHRPASVAPGELVTLPSVMVPIIEDSAIYEALYRIWSCALSYGSDTAGITNRWFRLGRDIALLQDLPAIPEQIQRKYFDVHYETRPDPGYNPWELTEPLVNNIYKGARECARDLPIDVPALSQLNHREWADKLHNQIKPFFDKYLPEERKTQELSGDKKTPDTDVDGVAQDRGSAPLTLSGLIDKYLQVCRNSDLAENTIKGYESRFKYVLKFKDLRDKPAAELTSTDIEKVKADMKKRGIKGTTRNKMRGRLIGLYNWAIDNDLVEKNPAKGVKKVGGHYDSADQENKKYYDLETAKKYIEMCHDSPPLGDIFNLLLHTGMRPHEPLGLKWKNIDEKDGYIILTQHKTSGRTNKPRYVPMIKGAKKIIEKQKKLRKQNGNTGPDDPVFVNNNGKAFNIGAVHSRLKKNLRKKHEELIDFQPGKLRHTCATSLSKMKVPLNIVKQILGHSDELMSVYYIHAHSDEVKEVAGQFSDEIEKA